MKQWRPKEIGYTGISFPFRLDAGGRVATSTVNLQAGSVEHIAEAIVQIIRTSKGERFFNRSFGAEPVVVVFERNTPEEMMLIASEIKDILDEYEPRVRLTEFTFLDSNPSEGYVRLRIGFSFLRSQIEQRVEVVLT